MSANGDDELEIRFHFGSQRLADAFVEMQDWMARADPKLLAALYDLTVQNIRPAIDVLNERRPPRSG